MTKKWYETNETQEVQRTDLGQDLRGCMQLVIILALAFLLLLVIATMGH